MWALLVALAAGGGLLAGLAPAAAPAARAAGRPTTAAIAACIRDPGCHRVFAVAHRAEGFGAPGNSRAGVARAVEAGVPVVEIDLRGARDGELFVMHDGRLEEATTGQGRVEATPAAEVAAARLGNGETVPRFPEIYAISRGRAVLSVDFKTEPGAIERVAEWVHAQGSFDDLIFFANTIEEMQAAARARQRYPAIILMVRLLDTRVTVDTTRMVMGRLPDIFHTERVGSAEVARLHALGAKVYMSALPLDRYVQPLRALAFWWLLRARADFVLTGDPLALMRRVGAE